MQQFIKLSTPTSEKSEKRCIVQSVNEHHNILIYKSSNHKSGLMMRDEKWDMMRFENMMQIFKKKIPCFGFQTEGDERFTHIYKHLLVIYSILKIWFIFTDIGYF